MDKVKVGDKVECIVDIYSITNGNPVWLNWMSRTPNLPAIGTVYTVREVIIEGTMKGILLDEIVNTPTDANPETGFSIRNFKKLIRRKSYF